MTKESDDKLHEFYGISFEWLFSTLKHQDMRLVIY